MSWTQALCDPCWVIRQGARIAHRVKDAPTEKCCDCGNRTTSGIYYRVDPATVKYPTIE
jgi:hypothetical protein